MTTQPATAEHEGWLSAVAVKKVSQGHERPSCSTGFGRARGGADRASWPEWTRHTTSRVFDDGRCQENLQERQVQLKTEEGFLEGPFFPFFNSIQLSTLLSAN